MIAYMIRGWILYCFPRRNRCKNYTSFLLIIRKNVVFFTVCTNSKCYDFFMIFGIFLDF